MTKSSADLVKQLRNQAAMAQEERAKVEALFSSLGEGVVATDERGKIIRINSVASDILGFTKKELLGHWFPEKIRAAYEDGSLIEPVDRPITKAFITGSTINERMYYKTKQGGLVPVAVSVSPIISRNKPRGAIEIFRDISLESESNQMKTDFISIASHQLRTPLSAIKTYTHMIDEGYAGDLNKAQKAFMGTILTAVDRMNELISTLLNVTRIEAGNITVVSKPVKLDELIKDIVAEFKPQAVSRKINLTLDVGRDMSAPINTDKLLVNEIVVNLLSNALKYTADGGSVIVSLYGKGREVIVQVHDTGYGIPSAAQPRIFTKFYRAPNVIEKDVTGTGLGLYLIKILAERLNGELWFKSVEGSGTDFYFSLPKLGSPKREGQFRLER